MHVGLDMARLERDCLIAARQRILVTVEIGQRDRAIVVRQRKVGFQCDGSIDGIKRIVEAPKVEERGAQIAVSVGDAPVQLNRPADEVDATLRALRLYRDDAEQMERAKMVRLLLQDFFIEALRVRQPPLLMQRQRLREGPLQRRLRWIWPLRPRCLRHSIGSRAARRETIITDAVQSKF